MQSEVLCVDPTCDCSNFDATTYRGTISCTYPETYCTTTSTGVEYCYIESFTLYYDGYPYPDDYRLCYNFTSGPLDNVCRLTTYEGGCEIEVDDVMCPSCAIATCPVNNQEPNGFVFDCSGTTLASQGSECDGDLLLPFQAFAPTTAPGGEPPTPITPSVPVTAAPTISPTQGPSASPTTSAPSVSANPTKEPTASDKLPCVTCMLPHLPNLGAPDNTNSLSGTTDTITPPVEAVSNSGGSSVLSRACSLTTVALAVSVTVWMSSNV
jgi:hypothetical protein